MTDLLLGPDGDLDLTGNQLSLTSDRFTSVAQKLRIRLRFALGEWEFDTRLGIPYFERILVKRPNMKSVVRIYQEAIRETAGVRGVTSFQIDLEPVTRALQVQFSALLDTNQILDFSDEIRIAA